MPSVSTTAIPTGSDTATPTRRGAPFRPGRFETLVGALEDAAGGAAGMTFHDARGELVEVLGYARLAAEARLAGGRMLGLGLAPGDRVGLVAETEGDFVRAFMGAMLAGLVPCPMPLPTAFGVRAEYTGQLQADRGGGRHLGGDPGRALPRPGRRCPGGCRARLCGAARRHAGAAGAAAAPSARPGRAGLSAVLVRHHARAARRRRHASRADGEPLGHGACARPRARGQGRQLAAVLSRHGAGRLPAAADRDWHADRLSGDARLRPAARPLADDDQPGRGRRCPMRRPLAFSWRRSGPG